MSFWQDFWLQPSWWKLKDDLLEMRNNQKVQSYFGDTQ